MESIDYIDINMMPEAARSAVLLNDEIVGGCHVAKAGDKGCAVVYIWPGPISDPTAQESFVHIFWGKVEIFTASEEEGSAMSILKCQGKKFFDAREALKKKDITPQECAS